MQQMVHERTKEDLLLLRNKGQTFLCNQHYCFFKGETKIKAGKDCVLKTILTRFFYIDKINHTTGVNKGSWTYTALTTLLAWVQKTPVISLRLESQPRAQNDPAPQITYEHQSWEYLKKKNLYYVSLIY